MYYYISYEFVTYKPMVTHSLSKKVMLLVVVVISTIITIETDLYYCIHIYLFNIKIKFSDVH